jgi:hypothetical protein
MHRTLLWSLCVLLAACGGAKKPAQDPSENAAAEPSSESGGASGGSGSSSSSGSDVPAGEAPKRTSDVQEKDARSGGSYDKESTEVVLTRAARQVKSNCGAAKDDDGKATGPWGKVNVKITLGRNGHTKAVSVPSPHDGKPVGKCIANAFSILIFPPWSGQDTDVDWEVELAPPEAAKAPKK